MAVAVRLASRGDALYGALIGVGALGFFGAALLPATGAWLRHVELPPFFETTSIVGPGGRTFAARIWLARIQRYNSDGRFEAGWFMYTNGPVAIGLTADGRIAVAAARTKRVEFFNPDGSPAGPPRPFTCFGELVNGMNGVLRPSDSRVDGVAFADPSRLEIRVRTGRPLCCFRFGVRSSLGFSVLGIVGIRVKHHQNQNADGPLS